MKITITSIELKNPFKFFLLANSAMKIIKQLRGTNYKEFRKTGIWTMHYTITLWESEQDLKDFARSGAHLEAMKQSKKIAKEIRTLTIDGDKIPDWKTAKELLKQAKPILF